MRRLTPLQWQFRRSPPPSKAVRLRRRCLFPAHPADSAGFLRCCNSPHAPVPFQKAVLIAIAAQSRVFPVRKGLSLPSASPVGHGLCPAPRQSAPAPDSESAPFGHSPAFPMPANAPQIDAVCFPYAPFRPEAVPFWQEIAPALPLAWRFPPSPLCQSESAQKFHP